MYHPLEGFNGNKQKKKTCAHKNMHVEHKLMLDSQFEWRFDFEIIVIILCMSVAKRN